MFSCIIVDDENKARILLRNMLNDIDSQIKIVAECDDLASAVKAIRLYKPQIVFLDIEMPGNSGIEILNFFNEDEIDFQIVFTTGYNEYAIQAFRLSALDYLMKPINPLELAGLTERIKKDKRLATDGYKVLYENLSPGKDASEKCILINLSNSTQFVKIRDVVMLHAEGAYTRLYIKGGEQLLASKNLKMFEEKLSGIPNFFRCHKSYIINLYFVKQYSKSEGTVDMDGALEAYLSNDKSEVFLGKMEALY